MIGSEGTHLCRDGFWWDSTAAHEFLRDGGISAKRKRKGKKGRI
mgnify:CR=1 FL=1